MALFTDGPISEISDLQALDSQLLDVAAREGIDVTQKIAVTQDEVSLELLVMLGRLSCASQAFWVNPQPSLARVVVTTALKLWHSYRALEMVYSDAYNNQFNDRYSAKRDQFGALARRAWETLSEIGIGVVAAPVARAGTPQLTRVAGSVPDGTYYATVAWRNETGQEGASAPPAVITVSGSGFSGEPGTPPANAVKWNFYAGDAPETMVLQNPAPLEVGEVWQQTRALVRSGKKPGTGQEPAYFQPVPRVIPRG